MEGCLMSDEFSINHVTEDDIQVSVYAERKCDGKSVSPWLYSIYMDGECCMHSLGRRTCERIIAAMRQALELHEKGGVS